MSDVSEIITILDDHGFSDAVTQTKVDAINDAYWDVCSREPWPFLEKSASVSFTAGDDTPTMPTDFRAVLSLFIPAQSLVLQPERLDTLAKNYPAQLGSTAAADRNRPLFYYFVGNELRLYPTPDAAYTATLFYVSWPAELTSGTLEAAIMVPARHHRVLVSGALSHLYRQEDDPDNAMLFETQLEKRLQSMRNDVYQRQFDRPDRVVDVYGDDYLDY